VPELLPIELPAFMSVELDAVREWDKLLSVGEQQRLAFGRVLVHAPRIVIPVESVNGLVSH
jgi:putative ATP-binding cassette transporter